MCPLSPVFALTVAYQTTRKSHVKKKKKNSRRRKRADCIDEGNSKGPIRNDVEIDREGSDSEPVLWTLRLRTTVKHDETDQGERFVVL